jgi:hypothetical protein
MPTNASGTKSPRDTARLNETEFLDLQAKLAVEAMQATIQDIKVELAQGLSPVELAKRHPWLTLMGSAVGGFAAAATLVPSKEQQALDRLRRINEANHPNAKSVAAENGNKPDGKRTSLGELLSSQLFGLIRPIAVSLLSAAMSSRPKPPDQTAQSDGAPSSPADAGTSSPL